MYLNVFKFLKFKYDLRCFSVIKIIVNKYDIIEFFFEEVTYF